MKLLKARKCLISVIDASEERPAKMQRSMELVNRKNPLLFDIVCSLPRIKMQILEHGEALLIEQCPRSLSQCDVISRLLGFMDHQVDFRTNDTRALFSTHRQMHFHDVSARISGLELSNAGSICKISQPLSHLTYRNKNTLTEANILERGKACIQKCSLLQQVKNICPL